MSSFSVYPKNLINPSVALGYDGTDFRALPLVVAGDGTVYVRIASSETEAGTHTFLSVDESLGNHSEVIRVTYTVPSDTRAVLQYVYFSIGKPSTSGYAYSQVYVNDNILCRLMVESSIAIQYTYASHYPLLTLYEGDTIKLATRNTTSSTIWFTIKAMVTEY